MAGLWCPVNALNFSLTSLSGPNLRNLWMNRLFKIQVRLIHRLRRLHRLETAFPIRSTRNLDPSRNAGTKQQSFNGTHHDLSGLPKVHLAE